MLYQCLYHPSERTLMLYLGLSHLAKGSGTRPLLSIPREQISTLYAFTTHPGGADLHALCLYHPFRGADHTSHGRLSQSLRPLLSISAEQISMLYAFTIHLGSRSYIPKLVSKPFIIHLRRTNLNAPLKSLSSISGEQIKGYTSTATYQLYHQTKPQKPQKPPTKKVQKSVPPDQNQSKSQP